MRRKTPGENNQIEDNDNEYSKNYFGNEDESGSNLNEQSQNCSESDISQHHQKFGGQFDEKNHCAIFGKSKTYLETRNINLNFKAISFPKFLVNARQSVVKHVYIYFFKQ